jgi:hypothetical protein
LFQQSGGLRSFGLQLLQVGLSGPVIDGKTLEQQRQEQQQQQKNVSQLTNGTLLQSNVSSQVLPADIQQQNTSQQQLADHQQQQQQQPVQHEDAPAPHPTDGPQQQQQQPQWQQHQLRVRVALLTLGHEGVVHSSQASLATAIARRLRNAVTLTMTHSTHSNMPESLVTFDMDGVPVTAAVQETSIFRDRFTEI